MPLHIEWLDAKWSIICCTGTGNWSWDEYHKALEEIVAQVKTADHRVDLIIARGPNTKSPPGSPMPHFLRAARIMPPNVELILITGISTFARTIVSIFTRINPTKTGPKIMLVASVENAVEQIQRQRLQRNVAA